MGQKCLCIAHEHTAVLQQRTRRGIEYIEYIERAALETAARESGHEYQVPVKLRVLAHLHMSMHNKAAGEVAIVRC